MRAPFRVAPDLVRLGTPDPDDPHDGLIVVDDQPAAYRRVKHAHLDDPRRPLVRLDPAADPERLSVALRAALEALALAHPATWGRRDPRGRVRLPGGLLALDPTDLSVDGLQPEADALVSRLRAMAAPRRALIALALTLQEDLVLMGWPGAGPCGAASSPAAADGLVALAASVVFPSGWDPGERIGRPLRAIHEPVADGERLRLATAALSRAMVEKGPFVRHVWTLAPDASLARWPGDAAAATSGPAAVAGDLEDVWFRVERQVTLPLPKAGASLFLIRVFVAPLLAVATDAERRARLVASLASMSDAVIRYKGLARLRERVLRAWGSGA